MLLRLPLCRSCSKAAASWFGAIVNFPKGWWNVCFKEFLCSKFHTIYRCVNSPPKQVVWALPDNRSNHSSTSRESTVYVLFECNQNHYSVWKWIILYLPSVRRFCKTWRYFPTPVIAIVLARFVVALWVVCLHSEVASVLSGDLFLLTRLQF